MRKVYKYGAGSSIAPMTANSGFDLGALQGLLGGAMGGSGGGGGAKQILGGMFGSGATPTSPWSIAGGIADVAGSFIPKKEQHQSTEMADAAYDQVANTLMAIPGWGTIAGGIMKVGGLLSDGLTALGVGTDGQTKLDRALDSKFLKLTPLGLVNAIGAKKTRDFEMDQETYEDQGSAYGGTYDDIQDAEQKAGKKYGLLSNRKRKQANAFIDEAERKEDIIQDINEEAQTNLSAQRYFGNSLRSEMLLNGGHRNMAVGRHGMSLQLISKSREIAKKYKQGGSIKQSIIEAVSPEDIPEFKDGGQIIHYTEIIAISPEEVPEFQDGGQIGKKSRTLQELIEYAKKENPRFIQRMSEPPRGIDFVDDEGKQARGSHYMEWSTDDNGNAIIYPRIQEVDKELKFFNSSDAYNRALENKNYLIMTPEEAKLFFAEDSKYGTAYKSGWPQFFGKFQQGGSINVIPEGALHARKHNMDMEGITKKGIPVISEGKDGEVEQQAEIERAEIILRLELTQKLEELQKKFYDKDTSDKEKDEYALEAGQLLVQEILYNTQDNANLINQV